MGIDLQKVLSENNLLLTFLVIGFGYWVGKIRMGQIELGSTTGVLLLLGSITGAMTSTPSLGIVTEAAQSEVPALGYAGTYTFANVLLTFAGTALMML